MIKWIKSIMYASFTTGNLAKHRKHTLLYEDLCM